MRIELARTAARRRRASGPGAAARPAPRRAARGSAGTLAPLYGLAQREWWGTLPICRPLDHTMFHALDEYVTQKLPTEALYQALLRGQQIEIHGVHPEHLPQVAARLGLYDVRDVQTARHVRPKVFNYIRPAFFTARRRNGGDVLAAAIVPGRDYVRHYAGLIRHFVAMHTSFAEQRIDVVRYPAAETSLPLWSGLDEMQIAPGATLVVGYVDELAQLLRRHCGVEPLSVIRNASFGAMHYRLPTGRPLTLLGVTFSFWGSISAVLTRAFCRAGVEEILYIGKLGTLDDPTDVYSRIFAPSRYVVLDHKDVVQSVSGLPNRLLERFPELDTHCHISVPTVMEEDYVQRGLVTQLGAASIDNEISQMAAMAAQYNEMTGRDVSFSALHFATDYVRSSADRHLHCPLDLSNNRTHVARGKKELIVEQIACEYLFPHFGFAAASRATRRRSHGPDRDFESAGRSVNRRARGPEVVSLT